MNQKHHLPSRFNVACGGGVPLIERRFRSLSFRFLSFFFFFNGVVGVGGDNDSTIGEFLTECLSAGKIGDSYDIERSLRCFFFLDFFRLSLDELIELVDF